MLLQLATLLSAPVLGSSLVMAEDVNCSYLPDPNGEVTCIAHLAGATPPNQTTWDAEGNGHSGGNGVPTDTLIFSLTGAVQLFDGQGYSPLDIQSIAGSGAYAYHASTSRAGKTGGNGGAGAQPGDITVTVGNPISGVSSEASGVSALLILSQGGAGGGSGKGSNENGVDGAAGTGGNGGAISGTVDGNWLVNGRYGGARSAFISSQGGAGGSGGNYDEFLLAEGANAGVGGNGGNIAISLLNSSGGNNQFNGPGGVLIQSVGGAGGLGGRAENFAGAQGGTGGEGGTGGNVNITMGPNVSIREINDNDAGLYVLSQGGVGGVGGTGASGGTAGAGGAGGNVGVIFQGGSIVATGTYSPGVLAQSLGGNGSDGGAASKYVVGPNGGSGSSGGAAGTVSVTGSGINIITGQYVDPVNFEGSPGILAQSIGGGGGSGIGAKGIFAVGGDGGNAVAGNSATVDLQSTIQTYGFHSDGITVQSIGGGGGKGGDASGSSLLLQMVLGGLGGGGGAGGTAVLTSEAGSVVNTAGDHASGLVVQSIGGGGGDGGAAYSEARSGVFGSSMSIGGWGGGGGAAGSATATNVGGVITQGADSFGILGQSLGGGGGNGGASTAKAQVYSAGDFPSISLSMAIGGVGGSGGAGNSVQLGNAGMVATSGAGSVGMVAQSIGGGGGTGGDASSASTASGGAYDITASLALGGAGGNGGDGGVAGVKNSGLIVTTGESADGMLVQSVGGGGGEGGSGDAKGNSKSGKSISGSASLGGAGGGGGDGHSTTAINSGGAIITLGDGAIGIGAQSIGGGGGRAGGGAASASGNYSATLSVGGSGGSGGSTYNVDSNNNPLTIVTVGNTKGSSILTFGADATGMIAQSIGGGGGLAGKSATNLATNKSSKGDGSNGSSNTQTAIAGAASNYGANGNGVVNDYNNLSGAITFANSLLGNNVSGALSVSDDPASDLDGLAQSRGETQDDNKSPTISFNLSVGGSGGSGGAAGAVSVTNGGLVATLGQESDAIIAQSIGGGGGKGGAASTATSNDYSGTLSVGGTGGHGGNGGQPTVINTGTVITEGSLAAGIMAQSIAGGGGIGGVATSSVSSNSKSSGNSSADDGGFKSLQLSVGGNGGANGESGQVYVTSSGSIQTAAHDSIGIIAQSIAGGGGIVKSLATDLEGAGGSASAKQTDYSINLKFGGVGGSAGTSGLVNVTTQAGGTITTSGDDSYGILAQSVAGGGGLVLGGKPVGSTGSDFFGTGQMTGYVNNDGGNNAGVFVTVGDTIATSGKGAVGILAQSIGGGGGLAGDTGDNEQYTGFGSSSTKHKGDGGAVTVTVNQGATVSTSGDNAPAIFVQSIGGGGGRVTNDSGAYTGTAGGTGIAGTITVAVNGTVQATGQGSGGIFAQSEGDSASNSPMSIIVGTSGKIVVGQNNVPTGANGTSAAIYIDHGGKDAADANTVTNDGLVQTYGSVKNAVAVYSNAGYTSVINNGTMAGDVLLTNNGGSGCFTNNGTFNSGDMVTVGKCPLVNAGTVNVGGAGVIGKTTISGDYLQKAGGKLVVDADFAAGKSDVLTIDGAATIAGTIDVEAASLRKTTLTVVSANGPLTLNPTIQSSATHLYSYDVGRVGNTLEVTPEAHFVAQAASFGHPEQAVASSLQSTFDSGATLTDGFAALAKVKGDADYASSLRSIAGEGLGAFGAFRINSSRSFTFDLYGGCRRVTSDEPTGDNCTWARVFDRSTDQDARADTVGYHADATTVEVGGQVSLNDKLALVFAVGSEDSTMRDDNRDSQISGNTAIGGAALNYANGPVELSGAVDGAYGLYRSTRTITVAEDTETANAKPKQWQIGAHLRAGYSVPMGSVTYIKPFVDGHAIYVSNDAFTESGTSPFRLAVNGRSDTALLGGVGTEFGANFVYASGLEFHPFVSAAVEFDNDMQWTTTAHFADQPAGAPFSLRTAGPGTLGRFVAGADIVNSAHWSFSLMYDPDVGHGYTSQAGSARVSYRF
jgi:uncharacterized protein YhjY with autotransporter beta-barrel domain